MFRLRWGWLHTTLGVVWPEAGNKLNRQRFVSTKKMKSLDRSAVRRFGIPSLILMENAGRGISDLAAKMLGGKKSVLLICGKGNNGGDGLVPLGWHTDLGE